MVTALPAPPDRARRLVYLGSPEVAVRPLDALVAAGFDVALVVSRPDRRRGRRGAPSPSPVKAAAIRLGLAVSDDVSDIPDVGADLGVVVAYGRILKPDLLAQLPFVNLHFSLLPRWRGAAPVERALLAGDDITGVCVMAMEEGLDTGGVYRRAELPIGPDDSLESLRSRLVEAGSALLLDCLANGFGVAAPQQGEPLYASKIDPQELRLDWSRPAEALARTVRLGRAWTTFADKRLIVHDAHAQGGLRLPSAADPQDARPDDEASQGSSAVEPGAIVVSGGVVQVATGDGWLELREVQPEGRARQDAMAWRNGARPAATDRLGP